MLETHWTSTWGRGRLVNMYSDMETGGSERADDKTVDRSWIERDQRVVWHGFTQMEAFAANHPVIVDRAEGRELIGVDGRRYLDAISSLWVTTLGHRVDELDQAVRLQLDRVAHSTMLGNGNRVVVELSEALAQVVPVRTPHFLYASDGAMAVEQALKIAFQYWVNCGVPSRSSFLALGGAYHGDSLGAMAVGDRGFGTSIFETMLFPVVRTPGYDDPGWADKAVSVIEAQAAELAAVIIEPLVQGAAGIRVTDPDSVAKVARACATNDVLLIADEVATGFGRTGKLFACQWSDVEPDLMCLGKGITGGYLPMAATVASDEVYRAFLGEDLGPETFAHGHSYGGNALAAAVALAHLELLRSDNTMERTAPAIAMLGELLDSEIAPHPAVRSVRRHGLMVGVELSPPASGLRWGRRVCAGAVDRGVLLRPLGDVVVVMPPLTTTLEEIERIVDVLKRSLDDVWSTDRAGATT